MNATDRKEWFEDEWVRKMELKRQGYRRPPKIEQHSILSPQYWQAREAVFTGSLVIPNNQKPPGVSRNTAADKSP